MISVQTATSADAGELLTAQLAAYVEEAQAVHRADIPPLRDRLSNVRDAIDTGQVLVARDLHEAAPGRLVGGVRLTADDACGYLGRLAVVPDRRREGIAGQLIAAAVSAATATGLTHIDLVSLRSGGHNAAMYARRGWGTLPAGPGTGRIAVDDTGIELLWMRKELAGHTDAKFQVRRGRGSRR